MNTINNTNTTNAVNVATETKQATTTEKSNWMLELAGLLFWGIVFFQFMSIWHDMVDKEFADLVIYNAFPLIGALAFFGIRREQKAIAGNKDESQESEKPEC